MKKISIFCFRAFDLSLLLNTKLLDSLSNNFKISIITHTDVIEKYSYLNKNKNIEFNFINYQLTNKNLNIYLHKQKKTEGLKDYLLNFILSIFELTYAKTSRGKSSYYFRLHQYIKNAKFSNYLRRLIICILSFFLSNIRFLRLGLVKSVKFLLPYSHCDYIKSFKPDALIIFSLSYGLDGFIANEFTSNGIKVISLIQSWDKLCTKGYAPVKVDYLFVWNNIMKLEGINLHDFNHQRIHVTGSSYFDLFYKYKKNKKKLLEFQKKYLNLNKKNKVIYVSLGPFSYHDGNIRILKFLYECIRKKIFKNIDFIIRAHPCYYLDNSTETKSYCNELKKYYFKHKNINFTDPLFIKSKNRSYIDEKDLILLSSIYDVSDIVISVISTQMIEALIFNCNSATINFGQWKTNVTDCDIKDFKPKHMLDIYSYNQIHRINDFEEFKNFIINTKTKKTSINNKKLLNDYIPDINNRNSNNFIIEKINEVI